MNTNKGKKLEKRNKILVFFIAFIMISSVFGVIFYGFNEQQEQKITYNGFEFYEKNSLWFKWHTYIGKTEAGFNFLPEEVAGIKINGTVKKPSAFFELDITSDLSDNFAQEIALAQKQTEITLTNFNLYIVSGFTTENEFGWPIITCNESNTVPVVYFKESNETKITVNGNCIIAEAAEKSDIALLRDRIVYAILGILNE